MNKHNQIKEKNIEKELEFNMSQLQRISKSDINTLLVRLIKSADEQSGVNLLSSLEELTKNKKGHANLEAKFEAFGETIDYDTRMEVLCLWVKELLNEQENFK